MKNNLQRKQLGKKITAYKTVQKEIKPPNGWIKAIRTTLGMTLEQLAVKLHVSKQNVQALEKREQSMSITLQSLQDVAQAMDMQLVYALVPQDDSLEALIERKALILANEIVSRTSHSMVLEDQQVSYERIQMAIEERQEYFVKKMPKALWD